MLSKFDTDCSYWLGLVVPSQSHLTLIMIMTSPVLFKLVQIYLVSVVNFAGTIWWTIAHPKRELQLFNKVAWSYINGAINILQISLNWFGAFESLCRLVTRVLVDKKTWSYGSFQSHVILQSYLSFLACPDLVTMASVKGSYSILQVTWSSDDDVMVVLQTSLN